MRYVQSSDKPSVGSRRETFGQELDSPRRVEGECPELGVMARHAGPLGLAGRVSDNRETAEHVCID
jgi:hypothetical protein